MNTSAKPAPTDTIDPHTITRFDQLNLIEPILKALNEVGYESPSPIQAMTIPQLLAGHDVIGQAQTGTGKTAAFALPFLSQANLSQHAPQMLVLTPTRELAIQVAEAFQRYATYLKPFHVLPIYGGQDYGIQLRALKRGVHVVVGTPGRIMDHMRRGTLKLDELTHLVLDEADEMLRMGFIEEVEWILEQTPESRQIALFSATMPEAIRKIAHKYLHEPKEILLKVKTTTAETVKQRCWIVQGIHKLDALTRILEAEPWQAVLIFVRTKTATTELSEKLEARGYAATAINGDIPQKQREQAIARLKQGQIDILVATDVAARGLDVERISHVVNYDIPYDTETYVHRIGRTGRAGRSGDAILFVAPRERRMLRDIERATRQPIELMDLPSIKIINDKRIDGFKQKITETLSNDTLDLSFFQQLVEQYQHEQDVPILAIASALAKLAQGTQPLLLTAPAEEPKAIADETPTHSRRTFSKTAASTEDRATKAYQKPAKTHRELETGMERYRLSVGHQHEVKAKNIVGAIANEAGLEGSYIHNIAIYEDYSLVDLPEGMPKDILRSLNQIWICGQKLKIHPVHSSAAPDVTDAKTKPKKTKKRYSAE